MVAAARKVKRVSPETRVTDAFCIFEPSPTTSPSRTVTDRAERPSQFATKGIVGMRRGGWTGACEGGAATAGAAFSSEASSRLMSAFTTIVGVPLRSMRNSASPAASLLPTFSVWTSTLKPLRWVEALVFIT